MFEELRDSFLLDDLRISDSGEPNVDDFRLLSNVDVAEDVNDDIEDNVDVLLNSSKACIDEDSSFDETRSTGDFVFAKWGWLEEQVEL